MQVTLSSKPENVFLAKLWGPLICVVGSLLVFGRDFSSLDFLLAFPFLLAALFGAFLAILEVRDGVLYYRRLLKWTALQDSEIVSGRVEWPPVIGSVRLNKFMFPWGKLYFVLDASSDPNPFHRSEYPLLHRINKEALSAGKERRPGNRSPGGKFNLFVAMVAGALFYGLLRFVIPSTVTESELSRPQALHGAVLVEVLEQLVHLWGSIEITLVLSAVFVFLAIYRRRRPDAWLFAFVAGVSLPHILLHWL
jgi:hypothetical protein